MPHGFSYCSNHAGWTPPPQCSLSSPVARPDLSQGRCAMRSSSSSQLHRSYVRNLFPGHWLPRCSSSRPEPSFLAFSSSSSSVLHEARGASSPSCCARVPFFCVLPLLRKGVETEAKEHDEDSVSGSLRIFLSVTRTCLSVGHFLSICNFLLRVVCVTHCNNCFLFYVFAFGVGVCFWSGCFNR
jgi:hypothetical protein